MSIVMLEKRARGNLFLFNWGLVKEARRAIKSAWRLGGRGSLEMGYGQLSQRLAGDGLALLLRFSGDRSFQGGARSGEAWRGRNDIGDGRLGFGQQSGDWVDQRADQLSRRHRGGLQGFMVVEQRCGVTIHAYSLMFMMFRCAQKHLGTLQVHPKRRGSDLLLLRMIS